ncbi:MAG: 30S ribosomal protein S16 [Candidatus Moranbacteria bacterium]|nr:30S ribosomal protein S16 [Candidatus Moranbacteria bacterium]
MLTIRLARTGKRNTAQFKIMLQERTVAPGGRHVEILGSYNPHSKEAVLQADRIKYWIEKGAFVSDTVHNLLVKKGVISEKKRIVKLPKKAVVVEAPISNQETVSSEQKKEKKEEVVAEKKEEVVAEAAPAPKFEEAIVSNQETVNSEQKAEKKEALASEAIIEKTKEAKTE